MISNSWSAAWSKINTAGTLAELNQLPQTRQVTRLICVEGWGRAKHAVRFAHRLGAFFQEFLSNPNEPCPPPQMTKSYGKRAQKLPHLNHRGDYISVSLGVLQTIQQLA